MSTIDKELISVLETAISNIESERESLIEQGNALDARESLLRTTIEGLRGSTNGSSPTKSASARLSISDERLNKVRQYLKEHPRSRQTDLVDKLGFNSGTVSVALRRLEEAGEAHRVESDDRSQVWDSAKKRGRPKKEPVPA